MAISRELEARARGFSDGRDLTEFERELGAATRAKARAKAADEAADQRRDSAIRDARAAGVTQARVMQLTGLSRQRVNQIVRGVRA